MSLILKEAITGPAAWQGNELADDDSWICYLSAEVLSAIDAALKNLTSHQLSFPHFSRADFPLAALTSDFRDYAAELEQGRGFILLRGLPVGRYSEAEINAIYYGLGLHLGTPVCQNPQGDLLGRVMNVGDPAKKETRVYETNAYLPYHTDPSDVFGLLCVRQARQGGVNSLVSSAVVYNEILAHYPEYLGIFYRPLWYAHLGDANVPGLSPIFSYYADKLSCRYLRQYIELGHEQMNQSLSKVEIEALDLFDSIMHDQRFRLDMMLEPGDMLFANNYAVMHSRTRFEDFDSPEQRRKLLRLWLKMPNARRLAPDFPGRNGFPAPTSR
ncbi:MAG: TauD/TfdA family dioxygenase [Thiolinea sp.]